MRKLAITCGTILGLGGGLIVACTTPPQRATVGEPPRAGYRLAATPAAPAAAHDRVVFRATDGEAADRAIAASGGRRALTIPALGVTVVTLPDQAVAAAIARIQAIPGVVYAEPDFVAQATARGGTPGRNATPTPTPAPTNAPSPVPTATPDVAPNDVYYPDQYGLAIVSARSAWALTHGAGVRIAILDTGIDQDHPDLAGKIATNVNFTSAPTVDDQYGHGTHVAGIAAAATNNGEGVAGTAYDARLGNYKVLGDSGSGYYSWIAAGITRATDDGATVINMSLSGGSGSSLLLDAVNYAVANGTVVAAAAGNSGNTKAGYPAAYANCIAVAATTSTDAKASFSTYGSWVDVAAPGSGIFSTIPNHANRLGTTNYGSLSGTSMATPFVAGGVALVRAATPSLTAAQARTAVEGGCTRIAGTGTYWVHGRLDVGQAVAYGRSLASSFLAFGP